MQVRRLLGCGTFGRVRLVVDKAGGQSYALNGMRKEQARRYSTIPSMAILTMARGADEMTHQATLD